MGPDPGICQDLGMCQDSQFISVFPIWGWTRDVSGFPGISSPFPGISPHSRGHLPHSWSHLPIPGNVPPFPGPSPHSQEYPPHSREYSPHSQSHLSIPGMGRCPGATPRARAPPRPSSSSSHWSAARGFNQSGRTFPATPWQQRRPPASSSEVRRRPRAVRARPGPCPGSDQSLPRVHRPCPGSTGPAPAPPALPRVRSSLPQPGP